MITQETKDFVQTVVYNMKTFGRNCGDITTCENCPLGKDSAKLDKKCTEVANFADIINGKQHLLIFNTNR